jgi:hypothetical protein
MYKNVLQFSEYIFSLSFEETYITGKNLCCSVIISLDELSCIICVASICMSVTSST